MEVKAPKALLKAQKLANLLDTAIKLPFIPIRIGLDSIVGLIPGAGDALMLLISLRIVWLGKSLGMPKALVAQMVKNSAIDFGLGFVPFIGDLIDVFYKANQKKRASYGALVDKPEQRERGCRYPTEIGSVGSRFR